ncbi:MAG TPA: amino acid--tRNA ligase-related protein, partial [Candidatus Eisenbacteria bacterium]|nr:amino acid--tRNA ligase-related protein [Candidatus Eisenbacteria bacterium]
MSIQEVRRAKLQALQERGIQPYAYRYDATHRSAAIRADHAALEASGQPVRVAGRLMTKRGHGKASFAHLKDEDGLLQIYLREDALGAEDYAQALEFDLGDWIGVEGSVFKTKTGEITVKAAAVTLLAKSLRSLPEKWHGLTDVEIRYRQRYLDLIVNPDARRVFEIRSRVVTAIRDVLTGHGFLEVETPMMQQIAGGALARPFVTHHNALDMKLYLRIAPELYLKRLTVGGVERVFEINRNFRNEGISTQHNPEFTMLEFYWAYVDYQRLMSFTEELLSTVAKQVIGTTQFPFGEHIIDMSAPFKRVSLRH